MCYWKNGEFYPVQDSSFAATVSDMAVNNNSVYMVGTYENGKPCLWKDGVKLDLTSLGLYGGVESMLIQNNAIYIAGASQGQANGNFYATLWKVEELNGALTVTKYLPLNTNTKNWAYDITAVGQNLYVSGKDVTTGKIGYWVVDNTLPSQTYNLNVLKDDGGQDVTSGFLCGIASLNQDVYVFGGYDSNTDYIYNYWKNGTPVTSGISWTVSDITSMTLDANAEVYMGGVLKDSNKPGYFKGQVRTDFATGVEIKDLFIKGSDVYAAGIDNSGACYWHNGNMTSLNRPGSTAVKIKVY